MLIILRRSVAAFEAILAARTEFKNSLCWSEDKIIPKTFLCTREIYYILKEDILLTAEETRCWKNLQWSSKELQKKIWKGIFLGILRREEPILCFCLDCWLWRRWHFFEIFNAIFFDKRLSVQTSEGFIRKKFAFRAIANLCCITPPNLKVMIKFGGRFMN